MKRLALLLLVLVACSKKPAPPPVVVVEASAPAPAASSAPRATAVTCEAPETRVADVVIVTSWRAAFKKTGAFEEEESGSEADAKNTLCRMNACSGTPPWIVKPRVTPHPDPTSLVAPLSGNRLVVLRVGSTGADFCEGKSDAVNRFVNDPRLESEVIVYDEETTPLRHAEDGCEQAGPPVHRWHAVDTRTKKEWVFRGDVEIKVEPKEIVAKKAGCTEIRYSR